MAKQKKPMTLNKSAIKRITFQAIQQTMILVCAYLMDDFNYDDERICEVWDGVTRYSSAIDEKLISMNQVCDIIEEHTGMKIKRTKDDF